MLIRKILNNHQGKVASKGMPLGNLTSQFFANIYLNELDQFVKQKLRAKYYIRYVDDFVILHQSRMQLAEFKDKIDTFLKENLELKLHPFKSKILELEKGIPFLGMRIFYHHKLLVKKNMRKFEKKMEVMKKDYFAEMIAREKVLEKYEGWIAYASHANTYKYRKRMTSKLNLSFPAQTEVKITAVKKHENFHRKVDLSKIEFTQQKTLQLINQGFSIEDIAQKRNLKLGTIWDHIANLVEHHQILLKRIISPKKVHKILFAIKSPEDKLKYIKQRVNYESISFNEIQVVFANVKSKYKQKSISHYVDWYQRTNCFRKCYFNKNQRKECRIKFQQLVAKELTMEFSKNDFLDFFHNHIKICILSENEKRRFMSWEDFKTKKKKRNNAT